MKKALIHLLAASWLCPAVASDAALQRCRDLRDPVPRLACYDAIPLTTVPVAGAASQSPGAGFGFESRAVPSQPVMPSIESAIDGPFDGWLPRGRLKLVNGQIWEIADGSTAAYDLNSPKVKLTRGVSGSFFIAIEGVAQTPRVRRIK